MIGENREMNRAAPWPQSIAIVAVATLACLAVAYFLWGFVSFSATSMRDMFGDVALPMFTGKLIQHSVLFWALPILSLAGGIAMLAKGKHSTLNLLLYVSTLVFLAITAITFTIVAIAIPWMPLMAKEM